MTEPIDLKSCSIQDFYNTLRTLNGIAPINAKIHTILCDMQKDMSLDAQKVLYIYFSLLDDGNTRLAFDTDRALTKWLSKFRSLIKLHGNDQDDLPLDLANAENDFKSILNAGIPDLERYDNIIETRANGQETEADAICKPFVCAIDPRTNIKYLYATRYFDAKCIIERRSKEIFPDEPRIVSPKEKAACQEAFLPDLNEPFNLADRQLEAIVRGQDENLIITGGPGTGKTTAICFLLWKLLKNNPDMLNWEIKLAAPSGKAADRMRESLLHNLSRFKDHHSEIYQKIHNLESYTLHRLLSYNPIKNQFNYNANNPFPSKYIFIIDEASMIDIDLFASFMVALPKEDLRLFILGDPDQLPSVQAGAVLGEMLATSRFATQLNESKRFDDTSDIGKLSIAIQKLKAPNTPCEDHWPSGYQKPHFVQFTDISFNHDATDVIHQLTLSNQKAPAESELKKLISQWVNEFYIKTKFIELAHKTFIRTSNDITEIVDENGQPVSRKTLDDLWKVTESARILSAERKGITGVENLNTLVRKSLKIKSPEPFFVGQLLMLTENQSLFKLYNGDCGIVLGEQESGRLHLMLKKAKTQSELNTDKANEQTIDYVTYPISMLPQNALESAFAITIHKSQGSGYGHIMMFLPTTKGHPLLNNQMIYTGVTRTERKSLTIVTTQEAFEEGCKTVETRDTGINISGT